METHVKNSEIDIQDCRDVEFVYKRLHRHFHQPCTKTVKFLLSEPISFAAVHTYIPLSAFVTSLMVSLPFVSVCVLSLGRIPRTLRHTTTGSGYPVQGHWRDRLLVELIFCLGGLWS